jgi:SAM-dependent methyltransferase
MEPELGDAYGSLLMAALDTGAKRGQVFEVVERDDGHSDAADAARYFAPRWGAWDDWAYERARGRVLDVGSGAGRHALELQERGCEVVALDVSPLAAEVCRRRGVANAFVGTIQELAASRTHQRFDTFLLMGNNLGLLESAERAPGFLETLAALAGNDAVLIGESLDPAATDDEAHLAYHRQNEQRGRFRGQLRLRVRWKRLATGWFDYLLLGPDELPQLLADTPWRLVDQFRQGAKYVIELRLR